MSRARSTEVPANSSALRRAALTASLTLTLTSTGCSEPIFEPGHRGVRAADPTGDASALAGKALDGAGGGLTGPSGAGQDGGPADSGTADAGIAEPAISAGEAGAITGAPGVPPGLPMPKPGTGSPEGDAGSEPTAPAQPLSALSEQLIGSYVARSYGFWKDNSGANMEVDELGLADFERDGDRVIMRMRVCRQSTRSSGVSVDLATHVGFPELRRTVSFEPDGWSTDSEPLATGFEREGVSICEQNAGQNIPSLPVHKWLSNATCRCPSGSAEPPSFSDCRITDDDNDSSPALTYHMPALGWTSTLATVIRSHHVRGRATNAGDQFANVKLDEVAYQLSCVDRARGKCPDADRFGRPCTSEHNGTHFVSLRGRNAPGLDCDAAIARESEFFPTPIPPQPRACIRDVLTDDPMRP